MLGSVLQLLKHGSTARPICRRSHVDPMHVSPGRSAAYSLQPDVAVTDSASATDVKADPDAKPAVAATQPAAPVEPPPAAPPENSFSSFLSPGPSSSSSTRIGEWD